MGRYRKFLECQKLYSLINKADVFVMNTSLLDVFWHLFVSLAFLGFTTSRIRQVFTCFIISGLSDLKLVSVYRLYFLAGNFRELLLADQLLWGICLLCEVVLL